MPLMLLLLLLLSLLMPLVIILLIQIPLSMLTDLLVNAAAAYGFSDAEDATSTSAHSLIQLLLLRVTDL